MGPGTHYNNKTDQYKKSTEAECKAQAIAYGAPAFGYRNSTHGDPNWRNTCFFYNTIGPDNFTQGDSWHQSECTDLSKKIANGCVTPVVNSENRYPGWHQGPGTIYNNKKDTFKKSTADECRTQARAYGAPAFGYRPTEHPDSNWRNTCFFYNTIGPGNFTQNDSAHYSECTDLDKKIANGCI